jgi:hypothetical protein
VLLQALQSFADVELAPIGPQGLRQLLEDNGYRVAAVLPPDPAGIWWRIASVLSARHIRYRPREVSARMVRELWESGRYSAVIGRYLGPSARAGLHRLPVAFVDIDDLESHKLQSWADQNPFGKWLAYLPRLLASRMLDVERRLTANLTEAWVSAEEDAGKLPGVKTYVIPNIPFYEAQTTDKSPEHGPILFVASLDYRVNVNALQRFATVVWPKMRQRHSGATLRVVGGGLGATAKAALEKIEGVEVAGFVDDLEEEYRRALFSVIPIWEGGGTKIKILESLAFDRTCVVAAPSCAATRIPCATESPSSKRMTRMNFCKRWKHCTQVQHCGTAWKPKVPKP